MIRALLRALLKAFLQGLLGLTALIAAGYYWWTQSGQTL